MSSVSETTAVPSDSRDDVERRVQARAREIEEELSRFCVDAGNRIPVTAQPFFMSRVFEMVQLCSDLRADAAAADRGAVQALKDQLVESRRETAALHRRALLAESRTGLLPPVAVAGDAATTAPAPTQPGAAAALPGLSLPGTAGASLLLGLTPRRSSRAPCDPAWTACFPWALLRRIPLPFRVVRQQLHRELLALWTVRWQAEFRHNELHRWVQDLRALPSFFPPPQTLVSLLTGHGRFPQYFYRFHMLDSPRCPCGAYCRDMSHVLHACPITAPYTSLIQPQAVYRATGYPVILESPRNRALLVRAVLALSDAIPDIVR
ncbi:hypothetical protein MTO96_004219 [Rhipicephalus appendiculatus]